MRWPSPIRNLKPRQVVVMWRWAAVVLLVAIVGFFAAMPSF